MITLIVLILIWGVFSAYRINKICKEQGEYFNPFKGNVFEFIGFMIGISIAIIIIVVAAVFYLP
jgi:hypothetical protein